MNAIDPQATLGDLVTSRPALGAALDRLGLDFCCGGGRMLVDAVAEADLDLAEVLEQLAAVDAGGLDPSVPDWPTMNPADLVDHLEATHHAYLHTELPRLGALAAKVASVHGQRHPELDRVRELVDTIGGDLGPHLRKEEQVLFPMIRQLVAATEPPSFGCGSVANPISVMLAEHDVTGDLLVLLREATSDFAVPDDGCASYRELYRALAALEADTHLHVHKENNVLFPAVLDLEQALAGDVAARR